MTHIAKFAALAAFAALFATTAAQARGVDPIDRPSLEDTAKANSASNDCQNASLMEMLFGHDDDAVAEADTSKPSDQ